MASIVRTRPHLFSRHLISASVLITYLLVCSSFAAPSDSSPSVGVASESDVLDEDAPLARTIEADAGAIQNPAAAATPQLPSTPQSGHRPFCARVNNATEEDCGGSTDQSESSHPELTSADPASTPIVTSRPGRRRPDSERTAQFFLPYHGSVTIRQYEKDAEGDDILPIGYSNARDSTYRLLRDRLWMSRAGMYDLHTSTDLVPITRGPLKGKLWLAPYTVIGRRGCITLSGRTGRVYWFCRKNHSGRGK